MSDRVLAWAVRAGWVLAPFAVGPGLAAALRGHSDAVRLTASAGAWAVWTLVFIATLVLHPLGLTAARLVVAGLVVVVGFVVADGAGVGVAALAAAYAVLVAVFASLPAVGELFVNGQAYPNERRFPLRPPGPLLLGPIELASAAVVGLPAAGALLLAARQWVLGGAVAVLGALAVWWLGRSLYGLARRWAVFVPAGFVIHDPMTLGDPVLLPREVIASVGAGASGLAIQLRTSVELAGVATEHVQFTPTRPGAVLAEAARRGLPVG